MEDGETFKKITTFNNRKEKPPCSFPASEHPDASADTTESALSPAADGDRWGGITLSAAIRYKTCPFIPPRSLTAASDPSRLPVIWKSIHQRWGWEMRLRTGWNASANKIRWRALLLSRRCSLGWEMLIFHLYFIIAFGRWKSKISGGCCALRPHP